jgi:hypothetical protein
VGARVVVEAAGGRMAADRARLAEPVSDRLELSGSSRPPPTPRNVPGAGEARNRTRRAAERTVPFALLTCTLIITRYARHGHSPARITARRHAQPWYHAKIEPASEDMLTQLRRVLITARISKGSGAHPTPEQTKAVLAAWHPAVA